jgi:hypothetical protein
MAKLDVEWAVSEIDSFLHVTELEQVLDRIPAMNGWRGRDRPKKNVDYDCLRDQASRGKAAMERAVELTEPPAIERAVSRWRHEGLVTEHDVGAFRSNPGTSDWQPRAG